MAPSITRHYGPDLRFVGGIASVVRVYLDYNVGADRVIFEPTWRPNSHLRSAAMSLAAIARLARSRRSDVLHVHLSQRGSFAREGLVATIGRLIGHPVVATVHGSRFLDSARRLPRLTRFVLGMCHVVVCLSDLVAAEVSRMAPSARVVLVPNPVRTVDPPPDIAESDESVLFAGEQSTRKGLDILLAAWAMVHDARPSAMCRIVGPPGDVEPPQTDNVQVSGPVTPTRMIEIIRQARVVVLPSRAEGMPMILTEAMANARPIIGTPVGGVRELTDAGGLSVPVGDTASLASAICELLENAARAKHLGLGGWRFCQETRRPELIDMELRELYADASRRAGRTAAP